MFEVVETIKNTYQFYNTLTIRGLTGSVTNWLLTYTTSFSYWFTLWTFHRFSYRDGKLSNLIYFYLYVSRFFWHTLEKFELCLCVPHVCMFGFVISIDSLSSWQRQVQKIAIRWKTHARIMNMCNMICGNIK